MLSTKFQVNCPFGSGEETKNRFSRWWPWRPSWIFDCNNFSYFFLQVIPMLPTKFKSIGISVQKKRKIDFQDGSHGGHLGFPIGTILAIFWSTSHPDASNQVSSQMAFWFRRSERKIDFQEGSHGGHLGFPIGTPLAIFNLQATPMLPTKFQVNWP